MVQQVSTVAFNGIEAQDMQVQVAPHLAAFAIVALPDKAVFEARERVRSALIASELALPTKPLTEIARTFAVLYGTISRLRACAWGSPQPATLIKTALCPAWPSRGAFFSWPNGQEAAVQCKSIVSCHPCGQVPPALVLSLARHELRPARFLPFQPLKSAR